ncbi:MAG: hypothetical protein ABR978_09340 [Dehalococcoidia bacterium]|jgi:thermostable 8-oxoguanine DNA glycosylase
MITAAQIRRSVTKDAETESLKERLAHLRAQRCPFFLNKADFEEILRWKLRGQFGRQRARRAKNTSEIIRKVTRFALTIEHSDKEYELELRLAILCSLRGVDVPVASAVLALVFPEQYAVIDFRGWRQVFNKDKSTFSIPDYKRYLANIRGWAAELGLQVQQVDLAIWEYDRVQSANPRSAPTT